MKKVLVLLIGIVFLASCNRATPITSSPTHSAPTAEVLETLIPTPTLNPPTTPIIEPTSAPTVTASPTPELPILPRPVILEDPGPLYETILQIPVGEEGILYRGAGVTDMEPVGPNGLVVTPKGVIVVGDVYGNRLMRYELNGTRLDDIDLTALDILNISDLVGIADSLYILEISFKVLPERYRVNQLTTDGQLVSQYDLPKGYHFEDGLFDLAVGYPAGENPQILIQFSNADDSQYYRVPASPGDLPEKVDALTVFGRDLHIQSAREAELAVTSLGIDEFESQMTLGGAIFLESARADGSLFLHREDLVSWEPITTDITIHYMAADEKMLGVARYPLMDWYFHIWRFLTVGPDGNVYGLITRETSVDVLRLNFYQALEPIMQGAAQPIITHVTPNASRVPPDCSGIHHLLPESVEAQQIVESFINNYTQDYPTEYMAFEQLWSVDQLEDYAVMQGMVTQEQSDIIVAQQVERGFVMVTWYISNMPLPGYRHMDLREYLQAQVPQASAALIACLDLSRFIDGE